MNPGENPDHYFNQKNLLRAQVEKLGETISDRRFKDICVQGFPDEYSDVRMMVFRDPTFDVLQIMQSTMRNIFLDEQSRKDSKGRIVGRGFAMTTAASDVICYGCNETGHIRRHCPNPKLRGRRIHRGRVSHLLQGLRNQDRVRRHKHPSTNRGIGERRPDPGKNNQVPLERWNFSTVHVGRADAHCGIPGQQITPLRIGRSYTVVKDVQQDTRPLTTSCYRSPCFCAPRAVQEEAGRRQGFRRQTLWIRSR